MTAAARGVLVCVGAMGFAWLGPAEARARAAAFTVTLQYTVGPGCPAAPSFKAVVIERLGYDPFASGADGLARRSPSRGVRDPPRVPDLASGADGLARRSPSRGVRDPPRVPDLVNAPDHVLVRIAPRDGSLEGRIEWRDSSGKWAGDQSFPLVSTDCLRLVRAMGFALAVQIQLLTKTGAAPHSEVPAPAETGPAAEAPAPRTTPGPPVVIPRAGGPTTVPGAPSSAPPPARGSRPVFAMGAGPSVGFGMSSTAVLLGRVFGALAWQHFSVELAAVVSLPATTRRADGAGFSQQHLLVSVASCAIGTRWNLCLVANAGQIRMEGEDIDRPTSAEAPVVEAGARVALIQRLGRRVFLTAHADGLAVLTRWTASLDQVPVWTAPRFAAAFGLDTGVRFP